MSKTTITFTFNISDLTLRQRNSFEAAVCAQAETQSDSQDERDDYPDIPHLSTVVKEEFV